MGAALQTVLAFKQNITGGAFEALAAGTGDALAVPNFQQGSQAEILDAWAANSANACDFDVRSPSFHDNTRGIRMALPFVPTVAGTQDRVHMLMGKNVRQPLYATDTLIAEVNGTATNNVDLALLQYFSNLPGADQRLLTWAQVNSRMTNIVGIKVAATAGATGDYGANRNLNQDDDRLIADTDYALLGATFQALPTVLVISGPDTSSRRIGIPGTLESEVSAGWFVDLSVRYQLPLIPVFNSNNRGNTIIQAAAVSGAVATAATLIFAELS